MAYIRKTDRETHDELYGLKDLRTYQRLYARKPRSKERRRQSRLTGSDSYYNVRKREIERMAAPEPTITVDVEAFMFVINELERQLKEFPENELLIINIKKQLKL